MAREKKVYEDDDGRTIADMSEVSRPNLLGIRLPKRASAVRDARADEPHRADRPWEDKNAMSKEDRRSYIFGALSAALMIGTVYAVVLGLAILLIVKLYG